MNFTQQVRNQLTNKLSNQFIRNISWLGASEVIIRLSRLATTVVLARFLSPNDYGLAAVVITIHEFFFVFTRYGANAKLIQANQAEIKDLSNSTFWLNWMIFYSLFLLQCLAAFPLSIIFHDSQIILPLCLMAASYLILPLGTIQADLIARENRLKITAFVNIVQLSLGNLLTIILAILGLGMWSIVLPRLLVAPIWVFIYRRNHPWRPTSKFTTKGWGEIFNFTKSILGTELLKNLRNNLDYLIIGRFLGIEALGIYYFAFNAGLGISMSIISAINSSFYPYICAVKSDFSAFKHRYFSSLKFIGIIIFTWVLLQSLLAPYYVPIVFGEKWVNAIPVLILICLSAIPRPFENAAAQLLIAVGKPNLVLQWNLLFTLIFAGGIIIGIHQQLLGVATAVLLTYALFLPLFSVWATKYVFGSNSKYQAASHNL
ncbi:lipopolysaccharide biosynthesis protein [Aerosakkonemataceae cyanobacterium BLCC-F154]|uniref:Lipopolysaccharide biosynthesis protein n=1 Tax=Floridaenema fluviatile BLCC-F154 TaxID=3153640 RepID=A0ABV4YHH2_9CYAN